MNEPFIWTDAHITVGDVPLPNSSGVQFGYARKQVAAADMEVLERCPDCNAVPTEAGHYAHAKGCLTVEVDAGRMTPRERQIERIEARERAEADWQDASVAERLDARMDQAMLFRGKPPRTLAVSPGDFLRLMSECSDDALRSQASHWTSAHYKGIEIVEDPSLPDGTVLVVDEARRAQWIYDPAAALSAAAAARSAANRNLSPQITGGTINTLP